MSGGIFDCEVSRENYYFKTSCLDHDVKDVLPIMIDCAIEPCSF